MSGDQTGPTNGFDVRELTTNIGDTDGYPKYAGGGSSTKSNHDLRLDQFDLCVKPGTAGLDFSRSGFLVQPALTKPLPLKVFDRIWDITEVKIDLPPIQASI